MQQWNGELGEWSGFLVWMLTNQNQNTMINHNKQKPVQRTNQISKGGNMQSAWSVGKRRASQVTIGFRCAPDWLKKIQQVCKSTLLEEVSLVFRKVLELSTKKRSQRQKLSIVGRKQLMKGSWDKWPNAPCNLRLQVCRKPIVREPEENYGKHGNEQIINKQWEKCIAKALKFYWKFNLLGQ